jgi:hypothetical protein
MSKPSYGNLTAAEQAVLDGVTVRLVEAGEVARFNARLVAEHYLHSADLVGEHLRYVAEYGDQWLALLTWSAAAYHLRDREAWIGWNDAQRRRPRRYHAPGETTYFRLLSHTDSRALETALLGWQELVLGPRPPGDDLVALDGKENRSSQGTKRVNAYAVKSGRWLGSEPVPAGTNEIPTATTEKLSPS